MCGLNDQLAKALLLKYQWNSAKLIDDFVSDNGGPELVERLFGFDMFNPTPLPEGKFLCLVCFAQQADPVAANCGHALCK